MATYKIKIDLDNAAFADDEGSEVGRILHGLAIKCIQSSQAYKMNLRDINGNRVGKASRPD